jgi:hypothetical protein
VAILGMWSLIEGLLDFSMCDTLFSRDTCLQSISNLDC